ncbi:pirna biogenesis protein exd1 [Holotrichia oblita]|uniref:Pirna biogenesis protein exd1 n=1 Tax=Holotrichia oblita TaxID=644536 RepID=A0ACB9TBC0_HOLOL|nr:pirna biogenesis protein exd1 [Holotrichia oblita]
MEYNFKKGDKLVLELINTRDDILEGEFVNGDKNRLSLINISSYRNKTIIKGPYNYYRSDILYIRLLNESEGKNCKNILNKTECPETNYKDTILIPKLEYDRLKEMSHNYIYMGSLDSRYYDAMNYLKTYETIGIAAVTTIYEKTAGINLIIISTWDQLYIIDFLVLNSKKFPPELEEILRCEDIKKVLHDSRLLTQIFAKQYGIRMKNIFDTKVADIAVRKKLGETPTETRTLGECLTHYFNFPPTLFDTQESKLDKWKTRPLSDTRKFRAAQRGVFLILVKNHLENILLKDFYKCVHDYANSLQDCCMNDVPNKIFDNKVCDILGNMKLS